MMFENSNHVEDLTKKKTNKLIMKYRERPGLQGTFPTALILQMKEVYLNL